MFKRECGQKEKPINFIKLSYQVLIPYRPPEADWFGIGFRVMVGWENFFKFALEKVLIFL